MRRVYILTYLKFPRSGAGSNYIEYLIDALYVAGYEVHVVANTNVNEHNYIRNSKILSRVYFHDFLNDDGVFTSPLKLYQKLNKLALTSEDVLIYYGYKLNYLSVLQRMKKNTSCCISAIPVEHFRKQDYPGNELVKTLRWFAYEEYYRQLKNVDICFPISEAINKILVKRKIRTLVLPPMVDAKEERRMMLSDKYRFIFPGSGQIKENFEQMLNAISKLDEGVLNCMELHLTGIKPEVLEMIDSNIRNKLSDIIIMHEWMSYDELCDLYKKMHYLLLVRDSNQMTISNFPSKIPETMAYGIVPVASRVGDYANIYLRDGKNSFLIDDFVDIPKVITKCCKVEFDLYMQISMEASRTAKEQFDYNRWAPLIRNTIESYFLEGVLKNEQFKD